jgi:parallel beta-helix repeat protein
MSESIKVTPAQNGQPGIWEVGNPGQPAKLIIHNGQLYIYDENGATLISGGKIQAAAIDADAIQASHIKASSITTEKINNENITNKKLVKWARAKQAVVSNIEGEGDYTSIQSAINYLSSIGGGIVSLAPGVYKPGADLIFPQTGVSLHGIDPDLCIIDFEKEENGIVVSGNDVNFENITIRNSAATNGVIYINGKTDCALRHCKFTGNFGASASENWDIGINNVNNFEVSNCFSTQSGNFIKVSGVGCEDVNIENNILEEEQGGEGVIEIDNGTNIKVFNNTIRSCLGYGVRANAGQYILISGNFIRDNECDGVRLQTAVVGEVVIINNQILYNNGSGIYVDVSEYVTVTGNIISENGGDGLWISDSDATVVSGNLFRGNKEYGIQIDATGSRTTITGNALSLNTSGHILDNGSDTIDIGNNKW